MNAQCDYLITREAAQYLGLSSRTLDRSRILARAGPGVPPLRRTGAQHP